MTPTCRHLQNYKYRVLRSLCKIIHNALKILPCWPLQHSSSKEDHLPPGSSLYLIASCSIRIWDSPLNICRGGANSNWKCRLIYYGRPPLLPATYAPPARINDSDSVLSLRVALYPWSSAIICKRCN